MEGNSAICINGLKDVHALEPSSSTSRKSVKEVRDGTKGQSSQLKKNKSKKTLIFFKRYKGTMIKSHSIMVIHMIHY